MASEYQTTEIYDGLRAQVLSLKPDQLGLNGSEKQQVLALLMETGYPEAVATLVAVADGSASLYFSNGGGIIGAGEHEEARQESLRLIALSQEHLKELAKTECYPLPRLGFTRFYAVTSNAVYSLEALEEDLGYGRHRLSRVFHQGHRLISAIRVIEEWRSSGQ